MEIETESGQLSAHGPAYSLSGDRFVPTPEYWRGLGFENVSDDGTRACLPADVITFSVVDQASKDRLSALLKNIGIVPGIVLRTAQGRQSLYRASNEGTRAWLREVLPDGVRLITAGDRISLPDAASFRHTDIRVTQLGDLSELVMPCADEAHVQDTDFPEPVSTSNPLLKFSLHDKGVEFEAMAKDPKPLLGNVCLSGQATMIYAPPNAGKTLITVRLVLDAISSGRIAAGNVYYINADDNSSGIATKMRLLDDAGAHTLIPGFNDFAARELAGYLHEAAILDCARGLAVIIDTAKKFTSLMDKRECSEFANACRQFVMRGGTIIALAHTNKHTSPEGKLRYAGTTDLLEDFDAAYLMTPLDAKAEAGENVVELTCLKRRGDGVESVAYAYAAETGISYEERLSSVRLVDLDELDNFKRIVEQQSDAVVIAAIEACVADGIVKKMDLARAAAKRSGVSERTAIRALERYTGTDPAEHRWTFSVRERGAKVFALLPIPPT